MESRQEIKEYLFLAAKRALKAQIQDIQKQLADLQESSESEEKSSAGDKYETHQEMLNQTRNLLQKALEKENWMLAQLTAIPVKKMETVGEGAVVKLSIGNLWISIPYGKINLEDEVYQLVSKESPLIMALSNLKKGDAYEFRGSKDRILDIF